MFEARRSEFVDPASGVSQRAAISAIECVVSNAERRGLLTGEGPSRQEVEHRVRASVAARTLTGAPGEDRPAADVERALAFDAFPFAMRAGREGPQLVLRAQPMIIEDIA